MKLLKELNESTKITFSPKDIKELRGEDVSDELIGKIIEWVWEYDPQWMPYGTMKARTGDPYNWVMDRIEEITNLILKDSPPIEEGAKQLFHFPQKFLAHLSNGKKIVVYGNSRYDAKHSLGTNELIIGVTKLSHQGPSRLPRHVNARHYKDAQDK